MRYAVIENGSVANLVRCDEAVYAQARGWVPANGAALGDLWDGSTFSKDPALEAAKQAAAIESARLAEIDQSLKSDTVLSNIAGMTNAQWDTFWTNRSAAQKDAMLKYLVLAEARRRFP